MPAHLTDALSISELEGNERFFVRSVPSLGMASIPEQKPGVLLARICRVRKAEHALTTHDCYWLDQQRSVSHAEPNSDSVQNLYQRQGTFSCPGSRA